MRRTRSRIRDRMTAVLAAVGVATLVAGSIVMGTAGAVQADDVPCGTPAQEAVYETVVVKKAWTETIEHPAQYETVTIPAVTETRVSPDQRYSWNPQGPVDESDEAPSWPTPAKGKWTANTSHYNGTDPLGTVFQEGQGNGGDNASWFYWTTKTVQVVVVPERTEKRLVKEAWTETVEHPAVTEQKLVKPAVPAGPPCDDETPPPPVIDVCDNLPGIQKDVPKGYTEVDGICTKDEVKPAETEKPKPTKAPEPDVVAPDVVAPDEVAGTTEALPTAVAAGLGGPTSTHASTSGLLGQGLVGAGLLMLLLAGALQVGRERGAHQA